MSRISAHIATTSSNDLNSMTGFILIKNAFRGLRANLGRSLLTILGIVIGITAIVLVVALGQGAQELILSEVRSVGGNLIVARPGRQPEGPTDVAETILSDSIKERDLVALRRKENVPGLASIEPAVLVSGSLSYQDNVYRPLILGWTGDGLADMFNINVAEGTLFNDDDIRRRAKVVVLGFKVKQELFGDSDAIGQFVTLRGHKLRVVGVLPKLGQLSLFNADELALTPYTTAQKTLLSIDHFHEIIMRAEDDADAEQVAADVRATLREVHGITNQEKDDFFVLTQQDIAESIGTITQVMTVFLVSIAAISLVVGGVGIMNIMLVSVTERTHEIGLRKAVGATSSDILRQFLAEAIMLTLSGGFLGTLIALALSMSVVVVVRTQFSLPWPLAVPISAILLGVGTSTLIGIIFGLYPAQKAAVKNPIEALRYE
jgi:putative ABC transport system permease protein